MAQHFFEIERRFLVNKSKLKFYTPFLYETLKIKQGYICAENGVSTRIRIYNNKKAELTIKGKTKNGKLGKPEFNIPIDINIAKQMMKLSSRNIISKTRKVYIIDGKKWEIDIFSGKLRGLCIAEIEIGSEKEKIKTCYSFLLSEITADKRYSNLNLSSRMNLNGILE